LTGRSARAPGTARSTALRQSMRELLEQSGLSQAMRCAAIVELIEDGVDVNVMVKTPTHDFRTSALFEAAVNGELDVVQLLLARGADVNRQYGKPGFTALYNAALYGYVSVVRALLQGGASIVLTTSDGLTPLYAAAQEGEIECVDALLQAKGMTVELANQALPPPIGSHTALHAAAQNGHDEVVRLLLAYGVDVDPIAGVKKNTPLMCCLYMAARAQTHNTGMDTRYFRCVQHLLKAGANLDKRDALGRRALDWAPADWAQPLCEYVARVEDTGRRREFRFSTPSEAKDARGRTEDDLKKAIVTKMQTLSAARRAEQEEAQRSERQKQQIRQALRGDRLPSESLAEVLQALARAPRAAKREPEREEQQPDDSSEQTRTLPHTVTFAAPVPPIQSSRQQFCAHLCDSLADCTRSFWADLFR